MTDVPFSDLDRTPANHFRLFFFAAVSHILAIASERAGSWRELSDRFPFLEGYAHELRGCGLTDDRFVPRAAAHWWQQAIARWEASAEMFLPIRVLQSAATLDHRAVTLLFVVALLEEDSRFGILFESLHGRVGQARPTTGLLLDGSAALGDRDDVRAAVHRLHTVGLLRVLNPDAPRLQWELEIPGAVWDALRGGRSQWPAPWARHLEPDALVPIDRLILPDTLAPTVERLPSLLSNGNVHTVIIRGPRHCGRHTILGAVARDLGRGVVHVSGAVGPEDVRWKQLGVLATALNAMPVIEVEPAPGQSMAVPPLHGYTGPIGITCGRRGGIVGIGTERVVTISIDVPGPSARKQHWLSELDVTAFPDLDRVSERLRMTGGNIRRAAGLARAHAALGGRSVVTAGDVRHASGALSRDALDVVATQVRTLDDWDRVAVRDETMRDLFDLELRCRHRERLQASPTGTASFGASSGVCALFRGPSGTGKTLAARVLAGVLERDLYRLDLSSLVDKYIGETEKNLERVLSRAEELDVMLLLDEGDALLAPRTSVQSSNDRYANLETNYLLQRLESFEGILVITTNAGDRIDAAFERRMDVVVDFRQADAQERWEIWRLHLGEPNDVDPAFLADVARRCMLSGGQIRNAALYAALHAVDDGGGITTSLLDAAIRREYRKAGAVCPLRQSPTFSTVGT